MFVVSIEILVFEAKGGFASKTKARVCVKNRLWRKTRVGCSELGWRRSTGNWRRVTGRTRLQLMCSAHSYY